MDQAALLNRLQEQLREMRGNVSAAADLTNAMDGLLAQLTALPPVEPPPVEPPPTDPPPETNGSWTLARRHPTYLVTPESLDDMRRSHPRESARFGLVEEGPDAPYANTVLEKGEHAWSYGFKVDLAKDRRGVMAVHHKLMIWFSGYPYGDDKGAGKILGIGSYCNAGGGGTGRMIGGRVRMQDDPCDSPNPFKDGANNWAFRDGGWSDRIMRTETPDGGLALKQYFYPADRKARGKEGTKDGKTYGNSQMNKGIKPLPMETWLPVDFIVVMNEPEKANGAGLLAVDDKVYSFIEKICWRFDSQKEGAYVSGMANMFGGNPDELPAPRRMEERFKDAEWWVGDYDAGMSAIDDFRVD